MSENNIRPKVADFETFLYPKLCLLNRQIIITVGRIVWLTIQLAKAKGSGGFLC